MIDLRNYLGKGAKVGENQQIWVKILWFNHVGNGEFNEIAADAFKFAGNIDINLVVYHYKGPLDLSAKVLDGSHMSVTVNQSTDPKATYRVDGSHLIVDATFAGGKKETITIHQVGTQTYMSLGGSVSASVHLAPGGK